MNTEFRDSKFGKTVAYETRLAKYEIKVLLEYPRSEPKYKEKPVYRAYISKNGNGINSVILNKHEESEAIKEGISIEDYLIAKSKREIDNSEHHNC